jgi:uncharacterized protein with GYD domain
LSLKNVMKILVPVALILITGCVQKVPLSVTNSLERYDIHCIYISRSSHSYWGSNHLPETDILAPGKTAEVMVTPGVYDVQVVDQDGDTYTLNDITIEGNGYEWMVTIDQIDQATTSVNTTGSCAVTIRNDLGNWDITGVWISQEYSQEWGDNHITGEILNPDDSYTAYVEEGTYDVYLEDEDGDTYTRWGISVGGQGYNWNVTLDDLDSSGG